LQAKRHSEKPGTAAIKKAKAGRDGAIAAEKPAVMGCAVREMMIPEP